MDSNYDVQDEYYFENYIDERNLEEETQKNYAKQLNKFCIAVDAKLEDIINDCKAQQDLETEEIISSINENGKQITQKRVTKFDVNGNDSLIKKYINQFEAYCRGKGNKNITINSGMDCVKSVLSFYRVALPDWKNLPDDTEDWNLLSKEDFKFVLADSSLMHQSLITFMLSTGFRITDCLNITIGEFMEATSDFHSFIEVDDFIDNAPDDMMGYWEFMPNKTKKKDVICKTFNSPESCNLILQNLRRVKNEYFPRKSKKIHKELKLCKSDALFGSKRGFYKKAPLSNSISDMYLLKNKKLYEWHINKIKQDISNGKISAEDYDKKVAEIPKFHAHACRKYFCTIIERHCANERRYRLMEGHSPSNKIDKSYINISKEEIKEVYEEAVGDLSVYYTDEQDIEKIREDFNEQLNIQKEKHQEEIDLINIKHQEEISSLKEQLEQTNETVKDLDQKIEQSRTIIPMHRVRDVITSYLSSIGELDNDRAVLLDIMVLEHAKNNPSEFKETYEYLLDLVKKLDLQIELSNKDIVEQTNELNESRKFEKIDPTMLIIIDGLLNIINSNEKVKERVGTIDSMKFDYVAEKYLVDSEIDLSNITEDKMHKIAGDVLIEYLNYND